MLIHVPWHWQTGAAVEVTLQRATPPLIGAGVDSDAFAGERVRTVGIGLWWIFITFTVITWREPDERQPF
jgi:hypothetical protein